MSPSEPGATPLDRLLDYLKAMQFRVEERSELFGEPLPYLKAVAVDSRAHQLVLVAEPPREGERDEARPGNDEHWRDLIFAVSGLRHHLRSSGPPALGAPVLLALVDEGDAARLRSLVEEIASDYALFSRLDINIVRREATARSDGLDSALTSLLPRVRRAIDKGVTVAPQDVERFWDELSREIEKVANGLTGEFGAETTKASVLRVSKALRSTSDDARPGDGDVVAPISSLQMTDFRSFEEEEVDLPTVGIVYGSNGTGKTSIFEAMELLWSGRSRRMPEGIKAPDYEKHLKRKRRPFSLRCEFAEESRQGECVTVAEHPRLSLGRTVLPQHAVAEMAAGSPQERFRSFLTASGLELPDFEEKVGDLRRKMCDDANDALKQAGIESIRPVNATGLTRVRAQLEASFAAQLPSDAEVEGAAEALVAVTDGAFKAKPFPAAHDRMRLRQRVEEADSALKEVHDRLDRAADPSPAVGAAVDALNEDADRLNGSVAPLRQLLDHLRSLGPEREVQLEPGPSLSPAVPAGEAARWLAHARGIERSIPELECSLAEIEDESWRHRLRRYIEALRAALDVVSAEKLEELAAAGNKPSTHASQPSAPPPMALLEAAGFVREPAVSPALIAALEYLHDRTTAYAATLGQIAAGLSRHPGTFFSARAARIIPALCDFELAREIAKPTGAVTRARETLVGRLLDDRLTPVVQELVSALVRFEWYFEAPLEVAVAGRGLRMSGLSDSDPDLDIRMLLNEAERTVVGIAWFLALHVLQEDTARQVLVLDDPASGFDETNKAAFAATLRSLLHLLKPKQFLISTHDESIVALFEQELGQVEGWPDEAAVVRCSRSNDGTSTVEREDLDRFEEADLERELRMLSLSGDEISAAKTEHR